MRVWFAFWDTIQSRFKLGAAGTAGPLLEVVEAGQLFGQACRKELLQRHLVERGQFLRFPDKIFGQ